MSFVSYLLVMGKRCCLRDHSLSWASIMIMAETNCIIRHLLRNYMWTGQMAEPLIGVLSANRIHSLVDACKNEIVSTDRKKLPIRFLQKKTDILKHLVTESEHELGKRRTSISYLKRSKESKELRRR